MSPDASLAFDHPDAERRINAHEYWYHTINVAPGLATPGQFDLRHVVEHLPWPDVEGKRCLDIGTYDGFLAFELERRGAAEVLAIDIEDHTLWDWPAEVRVGQQRHEPELVFRGPPKGDGFRLLAELRGSRVEWRAMSIYDLDPEAIGVFDVVVCGSLLLHLRDPIGALNAVRSVCGGWLLSSEQIELSLTLLAPRRPVFRLDGSPETCQWWLPGKAGQERLLGAAGFTIESRSRYYVLRFSQQSPRPNTVRYAIRQQIVRALTGDRKPGVLHRAVLARPHP